MQQQQFEAQVHIFVAGGLVGQIEPSQINEQGPSPEQRRSRYVVDKSRRVELIQIGIFAATKGAFTAILIDNTPCPHQAIVQRDKLGAHRTGLLGFAQVLHQ